MPPHVTMGDIYRAQIPFVLIDFGVVAVIIAVPQIATFLPSLIRT